MNERDQPRPAYAVSGEHPDPVTEARVRVDAGQAAGPLRRLWSSLGYDEINWTYTPTGKRLLARIGEFGDRSYHVRQHYVFCSGTGFGLPHWGSGNVYHEDEDGSPYYDFTIADQVYDTVVGAGHHPLVELAFTPLALVPHYAKGDLPFESSPTTYSGYEAGWWAYPPKDYGKWGDLVAALVAHCRDRYGEAEVSQWLWELWNEPDIFYWKGTPEQFFALYDVTAAAVRREVPSASVGGPSVTGGDRGVPFLRGFLAHCAERGTPLDFISFHTKGAAFHPWRTYAPIGAPPEEEQSPSLAKMLFEVRRLLEVVGQFPSYTGLPCIVDECDASVPAHWGVHDNPNFAYRNTEYYPVFQCRQMKKLLDLNESAPASVELATTWSFYFEGERYFEGTRSLATTSGIDKPVLNAYRMFAQLGSERLKASSDADWSVGDLDNVGSGLPEEVDVLATRGPGPDGNGLAGRIAVLVWRHVDDQYRKDTETVDVQITVDALPSGSYELAHYRVDHEHSNSHTAWQQLGAPQDPTEEQLQTIGERMELEPFEPVRKLSTDGRRIELVVPLPLPAVSLLVLTPVEDTSASGPARRLRSPTGRRPAP